MWTFKTALLAGAAVAAAPAVAADDGYFTLGTGASYSKGDYGELTNTKVLAVPVSVTYRKKGLKIRVSMPWVSITGPGSLIQTPEGRDAGGGLAGGTSGGSGDSGGSNSGPGSTSSGSGSSGSGGSGSGDSGSGSSGSGSGSSGSGSGSSGSGSSGSGSGGTSSGTTTGGGDVAVDDGVTPTPANSGRRSGIGDVTVSAVYSAALGRDFYLEPGIKLKLPTASRSKRIGTGKVDVTVSTDLVKDIGQASVYLHGRRKFAGQPAGSAIRSTWGAGAGASYRLQRGLSVGADYDWQQSSVAGRGSSSEITGWTYFRLMPKVGMTVSATKGLNKNSADFAVATSLAIRL